MSSIDHDLDRLMQVMNQAFDPYYGEAWNRRQVEDSLSFPTTHLRLVNASGVVPLDHEEAAGFYLSRTGHFEEELLLIGVSPKYRCRGLGRILIEDLLACAGERGAEHVFLEMRRGNPAESLYRSCGFEQIGERPKYYRSASGERIDAITFGRKIK